MPDAGAPQVRICGGRRRGDPPVYLSIADTLLLLTGQRVAVVTAIACAEHIFGSTGATMAIGTAQPDGVVERVDVVADLGRCVGDAAEGLRLLVLVPHASG